MQPSEAQVAATLADLARASTSAPAPAAPRGHDVAPLPEALRASIDAAPLVRADRLQEAAVRLRTGPPLTSDELASRIVARLVCDRLR